LPGVWMNRESRRGTWRWPAGAGRGKKAGVNIFGRADVWCDSQMVLTMGMHRQWG
jgi:hypothetical protein